MLHRINIGMNHRKILRSEFDHVSPHTIKTALTYSSNSETAQKIRDRALELLQKEVDDNRIVCQKHIELSQQSVA